MENLRDTVRELSDRIVEAQRPIKVLSAINWDDQIKTDFFASGFKEQPKVDLDYYEARPMKLDPDRTISELRAIESEVEQRLGSDTAARDLMLTMCSQFCDTVEMLRSRGTPRFSELSTHLYGTPDEPFHEGGPAVADLAKTMRLTLEANAVGITNMGDERVIPGAQAVEMLRSQLDVSVGPGKIEVILDDGIAADAAAGSDYIKMREDRMFSKRDVDLLEAHEGWVHVATTMNGLAQPVCTFLGKATPRTTVTQEGLAVLTEVLNLRSHPMRLAKLMRRIEAIDLARRGATFLDVFETCRVEGLNEADAWATTSRVFRGSLPDAGPFTKDLGYGKGLILTLMYVRMAIRFGKTRRVPMLFCGKVDLMDMAHIHQLEDEDLVDPPEFVPPPFDDMAALGSSLALSRFTGQLDLDKMAVEYEKLF